MNTKIVVNEKIKVYKTISDFNIVTAMKSLAAIVVAKKSTNVLIGPKGSTIFGELIVKL